MAIGFARVQYVKRSAGKNACAKSAYNSKEPVHFEGTKFQESKTYDWSHREKPLHHEVMLPEGADQKFKDPETLWNTVEQKENRKNSQLAMELVLALPDDKEVSDQDRINMTRAFVKEHFVDKGLAAQIDIHPPETKYEKTNELGELDEKNHNYHAHVLIPTRRFSPDGLKLSDHKARDLAPSVAKGFVVDGKLWGRVWAKFQNTYFEEKGMSLRVDPMGIVPQKHMGPVRMRGRAFSLFEDNQERMELNKTHSKDPQEILKSLTENSSTFSKRDLEAYVSKYVDTPDKELVIESFWKQENLIQLYSKSSEKAIDRYTSKTVLEEESRIVRLVDKMYLRSGLQVSQKQDISSLSNEQKRAFKGVCSGQGITCIEGYAGTGKSFVLSKLREEFESQGYTVRAFGPDNATVKVLEEKGFQKSENIHRFLFGDHYSGRGIDQGKELWIIDEAGKLGNRALLELLKSSERNKAQIVLSGCSSQMTSVDRGGLFQEICDRTNVYLLEDVKRQKLEQQRDIAKKLAKGELGKAIDDLSSSGSIHWNTDHKSSMEKLVNQWAKDQAHFPGSSSTIIAYTNDEVRVINELVRSIRMERGELAQREFRCDTRHGKVFLSAGDLIEFRKNDRELGVSNGDRGVLTETNEGKFSVSVNSQSGKTKSIIFNPKEYSHYQLGYATTYFRSQGQTVDRAYVLFSPYMNKEAFYVGLTRHVNKAQLYVSKDVARNLSDLKSQVSKSCKKETSLDYTYLSQIQSKKEIEERSQELFSLKQSSSIWDKAKGYGLSVVDRFKGSLNDSRQSRLDKEKDLSFYSPKVSEDSSLAKVEEIKLDRSKLDADIQTTIQDPELTSFHKTKEHRLSDKAVEALGEYKEKVASSRELKDLVEADAESKSQDVQSSKFFSEWQQACGKRNEAAYDLLNSLGAEESKASFSKKELQIIRGQAEKHEYSIARYENSSYRLEEKLKNSLPQLLYRLFPDGPSRRQGIGLRFGNKGSLSIVTQGERSGTYYDFEKREKGGLLKLIGSQIGLDQEESKSWASNFLGSTLQEVPRSYSIAPSTKAKSNWISQTPQGDEKSPNLSEIPSCKRILKTNEEVARYEYRSREGDLLFYTVRFQSKSNPKDKSILPISYGKFKGEEGKPYWNLKGYQGESKPLYNQHLLLKNLHATVLVVEGEKAADAAQKLYGEKGYVAVSWIGGAGAVSKSDWSVYEFLDKLIVNVLRAEKSMESFDSKSVIQ